MPDTRYSAVPQDRKPYRPKFISGLAPILVVFCMVALGVGVEGLLFASKHYNGWSVPPKMEKFETQLVDDLPRIVNNKFPQIKNVLAVDKFLASFLSSFVFLLLLQVIVPSCQSIKVVQPLINLGRGSSKAQDSILLDYASQNQFQAIWTSMRRRHPMVTAAGIVALLSAIYQPLAGGLIQINSTRMLGPQNTQAIMSGLIERNIQAVELPTTFLAAAGFNSVNMISTGLLPPFVRRGGNSNAGNNITGRWVVPPFQMVGDKPQDVSATIYIQSQALYIHGECAPAQNVTMLNNNGTTIISGGLSSTCLSALPVAADNGTWYGTVQSADPSCAKTIISTWPEMPSSTSASFWPVAFAFARGTFKSMAFCVAYQTVYNATVASNVDHSDLVKVNATKAVANNSLTGYVHNGVNLTGFVFRDVGGDIRTEENDIGYLLADSVIRGAGVQNGVMVNTASQRTQLSGDISRQCLNSYLDYLATLALRIYVYSPDGSNNRVNATLETWSDRFHVYPPPAHTLAVVLLFTGFLLGCATYNNHLQRMKYLHVRNAPGTIGAAAVLLSESSVFKYAEPTHSLKAIKESTSGKKFHIDPDSWVIEESPSLGGLGIPQTDV